MDTDKRTKYINSEEREQMKCENCEEENHIVDITNFTFEVKERISVNACCKQCAEDKMRKDGYVDFDEFPY